MVDANWILIVAAMGGALVGGLLLLVALAVLVEGTVIAANLLAWAAEYGFAGIALYTLLWVFVTPVMITLCVVGGVIRVLAGWLGTSPEAASETGSHANASGGGNGQAMNRTDA